MLKLSVTLILEAHCPQCGRSDLPLGENSRFGVVAVCPGCGWEHQVQFLKQGQNVDTGAVLSEISSTLQDALAKMNLPQDVHLKPVRERRELKVEDRNEDASEETEDRQPPAPPGVIGEPGENPFREE